MAWLFQGVLNAGLQILLSIAGGWLCARLKLVDPEVMSRNVNLFAMKAAYPAFIIHLLGVKTDLRDGQAWKALGVFVLWVFLIHLACYIVHKLKGNKSSVLQLGLNCLLLTTNNTGCIGWPVLIATVGQQSAVLSMLLGVLFFIQLLPVSICCFEYHKWQQSEGKQLSPVAQASMESDLHAGDQLPVAKHCKDKQQQLALPATATGFPHEFRYCYWSNELYQPSSAKQYALLPAPAASQGTAPVVLAEVCVEDSEDEAADHHCYGGGSVHVVSRSSTSSSLNLSQDNSAGGRASTARPAPGREWWRAGRSGKPQTGRLKRAKDSCDSLYTPFAAAAASAKQAELEQQAQQQHRPNTLGLSSLTRRLSRGLSAAGAAAAAAMGAVGAAASPSSLKRAATLQSAGPLTPKGPGAALKKAPSLKPAGSLRRTAAGKDPLCQMSVPLMSEHSGEALSCCRSHRTTSPPTSPPANSTAAAAAAAMAGPVGRVSDVGSRRVSEAASGRSSEAGASSSSQGGSDRRAAAAPAGAADPTQGASSATAGSLAKRLPGMACQQLDSAVELHIMCETLADDSGKHNAQQQQQAQAQVVNKGAAVSAGGLPPVASFADLAARGAVGSASAVSSNGSVGALHTLGSEDTCNRINSNTGRISSRTNLLPCCGVSSSSSAVKGASKLGKSAASAAAGGAAAAQARTAGKDSSAGSAFGTDKVQRKAQKQQGQNVFRRFVQGHPLLCHIVWNQAQSFHLWLNVLAIALSVTGARVYLDPQSPQAIPALGFVDGVLAWFSAACIPTLLFANGVWMCGKDVLCGGWRGQLKVLLILLLKLTILPALMIGLTQLCNIRGEYGLSLVLLASCPLAPLAFLVCQQYGFGAELATSITIQGVLLMLPQMMAVIKINQLGGLYDVPNLGT